MPIDGEFIIKVSIAALIGFVCVRWITNHIPGRMNRGNVITMTDNEKDDALQTQNLKSEIDSLTRALTEKCYEMEERDWEIAERRRERFLQWLEKRDAQKRRTQGNK